MQIISISTACMLFVVCTTPTAKRDLLATPSVIEQPALIDRELFFGDPQISNAAISPDGRFITFIKPYRGVANLYVKARAEPFEAARPLTAATRRFEAFRIEISPEDASSSTTLWVEKAAAHRVLKQTQRFDQNQSLASELLGDGPRGSSR